MPTSTILMPSPARFWDSLLRPGLCTAGPPGLVLSQNRTGHSEL